MASVTFDAMADSRTTVHAEAELATSESRAILELVMVEHIPGTRPVTERAMFIVAPVHAPRLAVALRDAAEKLDAVGRVGV